MALPADWSQVPIAYHAVYLDGSQATGTLVINASFTRVLDDDPTDPIWVAPKGVTVTLASSGATTFTLPATDDPDINPTGWTYTAVENFTNGGGRSFTFQVPIASLPGGINLGRVGVISGDSSAGTLISTYGVIRSGTGAPLDSLGNNNDYYIDTTPGAQTITGPKAAGAWPDSSITIGGGGGGGGDPASAVHAAASKTTPANSDETMLLDSATSFSLKKLTWANLKAGVKTYLDGTGIAKLSTARTINGVSFDGTANIAPTLDQIALPLGNVDFNSVSALNLVNPSTAQGAATKNYVDTGLSAKANSGASVAISQLPAGSILQVIYTGSAWPARPTARTDVSVYYQALALANPAPTDFVAGKDYLIRPTT